MAKRKKFLERLKNIEEENSLIKELENKPKYLIFFDKGFVIINNELKKLDYKTYIIPEFLEYPKKERYYKKHRFLNSKSKDLENIPIIFITKKPYTFFYDLMPRKYTIFHVKGNYSTSKLVNKLIEYLKNKQLLDDIVHIL